MKILVAGLGLIGGSYCKAITKYTNHEVFGYDIDDDVIKSAQKCGCIKKGISSESSFQEFQEFDMVIVGLHPNPAKSFMNEFMGNLKKGAIITDVCGIKGDMVTEMTEKAIENDICYVGTHPMAGKERFGFEFSDASLFINANFIVTPIEKTDKNAILIVEKLARDIGFSNIVETSPCEHDRVIAYTSQLAHVVSSAYVKSSTMQNESGFSAGSFSDMTRTATLNESMWTSLFLANKKYLLSEIDCLIKNLNEYRNAISEDNSVLLEKLLKDGRILKEENLKKRKTD